jgi:hypothetical protein
VDVVASAVHMNHQIKPLLGLLCGVVVIQVCLVTQLSTRGMSGTDLDDSPFVQQDLGSSFMAVPEKPRRLRGPATGTPGALGPGLVLGPANATAQQQQRKGSERVGGGDGGGGDPRVGDGATPLRGPRDPSTWGGSAAAATGAAGSAPPQQRASERASVPSYELLNLGPGIVADLVSRAASDHAAAHTAERSAAAAWPEGAAVAPGQLASAAAGEVGKAAFLCADGRGAPLPLAWVNDDYCDCADGSDEPRTSACSGLEARLAAATGGGRSSSRSSSGGSGAEAVIGLHRPNPPAAAGAGSMSAGQGGSAALFACGVLAPGVPPRTLWASRIRDGVCDCCDGSDESDNGAAAAAAAAAATTTTTTTTVAGNAKKCPDTCGAARAEAAAQAVSHARGLAAKRRLYGDWTPAGQGGQGGVVYRGDDNDRAFRTFTGGVRAAAGSLPGGNGGPWGALRGLGSAMRDDMGNGAPCLSLDTGRRGGGGGSDGGAVFEVCVFGKVTQSEHGERRHQGRGNGRGATGPSHLLGHQWRWEERPAAGGSGSTQLVAVVSGGDGGCPGVYSSRRAEVRFSCGEKDEVVRAEEPATCSYAFDVTTPAACVG